MGARTGLDSAKIVKIAGLNIGIAVVNTVLFSPGFLGVQIGGASILATAFGCTVIFMSVGLFCYGNYKLLAASEKVMPPSEIKTTEDYINALKQNGDKKTFAQDIEIILEQIERLQKKQETIKDILLQKFNSAEMSYQKFQGAIQAVGDIFYLNIKSILNKLNAFDEEDFRHITKNEASQVFSKDFIQSKKEIYNEYIQFVKKSMEENEQILLKLDKLLLEISKFNSLDNDEIENMSGMKEIDELISQAKYYK